MALKLTQLVPDRAIVPRLAATDRDGVIAELVDALVSAGAAAPAMRQELITRVLAREKQGSTGFGKGVAVPHVKHDSVATMRAAIGLSTRGIDFASLDRQPVYAVFLLMSPIDRPDEHLTAMEAIFGCLMKETFRRLLRQATSAQEIRTLLEEADDHQFA